MATCIWAVYGMLGVCNVYGGCYVSGDGEVGVCLDGRGGYMDWMRTQKMIFGLFSARIAPTRGWVEKNTRLNALIVKSAH